MYRPRPIHERNKKPDVRWLVSEIRLGNFKKKSAALLMSTVLQKAIK